MREGAAQDRPGQTAPCAEAPLRRTLVRLSVTLLCGALCTVSGTGHAASLYRCTDPSGASVFTDTPAQLQGCRELESEVDEPAEAAPVSLPAPPVPAGEPSEPPGDQRAAATAEDPDEIVVPVRRAGSLLMVATTVNGTRQAVLILDTGASHTILSPDVAFDLGLLGDPEGQLVTLKTAGGPVQAEVVRVASIRIGDAEVENTYAAIYELPDSPPGIDGLLGLTFLRQFQVTLDAARGLLHLRKPGS